MAVRRDLILSLDFGGTKLAAGIFDPAANRLLHAAQAETRAALGAETALADMLALAGQLPHISRAGQVGVSFGGHVRDNQILRSLHVAGWDGYPLAQHLRQCLGVDDVRIANDANAMALGEWRFGAGRDVSSLLFITVSTGIGGAVIVGGRLWAGAAGMAGEIGHMQLAADGPECTCGQRGCLEALAAGPAVVRRAAALGLGLAADAAGGAGVLTARAVAERAAVGDAAARQALVECAQYLGLGVANAVNLLDVERVVIGGGVSRAGALWWETVRATVQGRALPRGAAVAVVPSELGEYVSLWGAAALATT